MYKIWRQAHKGLNGSTKWSKVVASSKESYANAFSKLPGTYRKGEDLYWMYLKLFLTEDEANKEIFNIYNYGK